MSESEFTEVLSSTCSKVKGKVTSLLEEPDQSNTARNVFQDFLKLSFYILKARPIQHRPGKIFPATFTFFFKWNILKFQVIIFNIFSSLTRKIKQNYFLGLSETEYQKFRKQFTHWFLRNFYRTQVSLVAYMVCFHIR